MAVILQKKVENVRYLFGSPETAQSRYSQLKRTFTENKVYELFAEPIYSAPTNTIMWSTDIQGSAVNYKKLSPTDQIVAQKLLTNNIQKILTIAKQYNDETLIEFVYQCIEIPSMDNVFLIRTKEGDKVVITQWGFVSDVPGDERGLLAKIIEVKRVDVVINVVYEDNKNEPVPNQLLYIDYEDQSISRTSDIQGKIVIPEVRVEEQIKVYRKEDNNIVDEQNFVCYENGKYVVSVPRIVDMNFQVINQFDKPVAGQTFTFDSNGVLTTMTSDSEGKITLPKQKYNQTVVAFQTKEEQRVNEQSFVCPKDPTQINFLRIVEEQPVVVPPIVEEKPAEPQKSEEEKKYTMKIKVVDKKDNPLPNARVTLKYMNKTVEKISDENGYVYIEDIKPNTNVSIKAVYTEKK